MIFLKRKISSFFLISDNTSIYIKKNEEKKGIAFIML